MIGDNARYLSQIDTLLSQARRLGHKAIETSLYNLLLKRTAPSEEGRDGGRIVQNEALNNDIIIHEFVF